MILCASSALADVVIDPPMISAVGTSRVSARFIVTPGPSGAPGGFTVEWIPAATYDLLGGWPDESDPRIIHANFAGAPTLNTTDGTTEFRLDSGEQAGVELGDLYDETGVMIFEPEELDENTDYILRARSNGYTNQAPPSDYCDNGHVHTRGGGQQECRYSQGFWKNHSQSWPTTTLQLGTHVYSQAQLLDILDRRARGNGLVSLAHQLIAAKLNVENGAAVPVTILNAIAQADALIGNLIVPPVGVGALDPSLTSTLNDKLDRYNGAEDDDDDHCSTITASRTSSWGHLKNLYR
jgi:hypothetical protein